MSWDPTLVEEIVKALDIKGGSTQRRPVHTVGIGVTGSFEPSDVAARWCVAEHFKAPQVDTTVRFSNGIGLVEPHDGWSDVRGMAVRFHLSGGTATDLIAMTLPVFFAPTPETFLAFARAVIWRPCAPQTPVQKIAAYLGLTLPMPDPYDGQRERPDESATEFADRTDWAKPAVLNASRIGAPVSYVRAAYHAVHTFLVTGADEVERPVRFSWQPVAGVLKMTDELGGKPIDPHAPPTEYLARDMRDRLHKGIERFTLMMTLGETGDPFDDSTRQWPLHRRRIMMGTLTLKAVVADQEAQAEKLSFNPCLFPGTGIRASDDPVLAIRREVYEFSSKRRGGIPCPFSHQADDKA